MATEVAVTSDLSGQLWNVCLWNLDTGTSLMTFKGDVSGPRTLCLVKRDYLISSQKDKQVLNVWSLRRREQLQQRMICPGKVTALSVSPNGEYCVIAIEEKLHIWQLSSGNLLAVLTRHYQPVTCLKFNTDSSYIISAGDDCLVLAWNLQEVLNLADELTFTKQDYQPHCTWSQHSLPVTDVCVGCGCGTNARVASVSLDQTCKIFDLSSGHLLLSVIFDTPLYSVIMDTCEYYVIVGSSTGHIHKFNLYNPPRTVECHYEHKNVEETFEGHTKQVTCLSISMDSSTLLSGSHDCTVRIWDISSKHCIRVIPHKGPVVNAFITTVPNSIFAAKSTRSKTNMMPIIPFKRHLHGTQKDDEDMVMVNLKNNPNVIDEDLYVPANDEVLSKLITDNVLDEGKDYKTEVSRLKQINEQMFVCAVDYALNRHSGNSTDD